MTGQINGGITGPGLGGFSLGGTRQPSIDSPVPKGAGRAKPNKPRVFGLGLSKTGTTSLAKAVEILGYTAIHYPKPEFMLLARFAVIEDYDAAFDTTVAAVFPHLDRFYQGSKFILTTRDETPWINSLEKHLKHRGPATEHGFEGALRRMLFGTAGFDHDRLIQAKRDWEAQVRDYFANRPRDLLEIDLANGGSWDTLCPFLDEPIPEAPFPHANKNAASAKAAQRKP